MTDIGELVVRIKADAAQLEREMAKANGAVKSSASSMQSSVNDLKASFAALLPALSIAALFSFGKSAFEAADRLNDLALRTGFAGSTLSALNIPLKQSGSSVEEFSASINRMNNLIGEAAKGTNQEAIKAFDALGLSVKKLTALSPEQQFIAIGDALGRMTNQGQQTNAGMAIFGRSFATILPLIKEAHGDFNKFLELLKKAGYYLDDGQLKRIDALGDRWTATLEKMKMKAMEVIPLLEKIASVPDYVQTLFIDNPQTAGRGIVNYFKTGSVKDPAANPLDADRNSLLKSMFAPVSNDKPIDAKGSNKGLLKGDGAKEQAEDYDTLTGSLDAYLRKQEMEYQLLGMTEKQREAMKVVYEAQNIAIKEGNLLAPDEIANIKARAEAAEDLKDAMAEAEKQQQKNIQIQAQLEHEISSSLASIALDYKSFGDTLSGVMRQIAQQIIEMQITNPLVQSIGGLFKGGSLFSSLPHFAAGGNITGPSIVGENGPELFNPGSSGTIIPNHKLGGQAVTVVQNIHLNPGASEQTVAQLRNLVPSIAAAAHASVMQAFQKGGSESRIVGRRS